jgi:hypothetical protein
MLQTVFLPGETFRVNHLNIFLISQMMDHRLMVSHILFVYQRVIY